MEIFGKKVAILGFGLEGKASVDFALGEGAAVSVFEKRPESDYDAGILNSLRARGVQLHFGEGDDLGGFDLIIRSPGVPLHLPELALAIRSGVPVTSGTAIFFERWQGKTIGVTGTKGKGTTSSLIHQMLLAGGRKAVLLGNIGLPALSQLSDLTTDTIVVYELSSFQLLEATKSPTTAVVLMITQDHLDFHLTQEEYEAAKRKIVAFQTEADSVVANSDYESSKRVATSSRARKFWVSRNDPGEDGCFVRGNSVWLRLGGKESAVAEASQMNIYGAHNLENVCAAVMAATLEGISIEDIRTALREFKGLPHRLELVSEKNGVKYFDDSISTAPESAMAAIRAFKEPKILILGGSSKGADFSALGKLIAEDGSIRMVIGIGAEWPRIRQAIFENGGHPSIIEDCRDMKEVVARASAAAKPGDLVMLSPGCASFDMFRDYKDRGEQFAACVRGLSSY